MLLKNKLITELNHKIYDIVKLQKNQQLQQADSKIYFDLTSQMKQEKIELSQLKELEQNIELNRDSILIKISNVLDDKVIVSSDLDNCSVRSHFHTV